MLILDQVKKDFRKNTIDYISLPYQCHTISEQLYYSSYIGVYAANCFSIFEVDNYLSIFTQTDFVKLCVVNMQVDGFHFTSL